MTLRHHNRQDFSGRFISPTQRPLTDNTYNNQKWRTSLPRVGFEPVIPASEQLQTHTLNRGAAGIDKHSVSTSQYFLISHLLNLTSHFRPNPISPISNTWYIINIVLTSFLSLHKSFFFSTSSLKFISVSTLLSTNRKFKFLTTNQLFWRTAIAGNLGDIRI